MNDNFKYQMIAIQALNDKYGFNPAPEQVKLLESDGEGTYILFRVGEHEYRCDNGKITNLEEQKKLDEDIDFNMKIYREKCIAEDQIKILKDRIQTLETENASIKPLRCSVEWLNEEREKVEKVLNDTRAEALKAIENPDGTLECKKAWYHSHEGEIEMAWFLGLISERVKDWLKEEWLTHKPTA